MKKISIVVCSFVLACANNYFILRPNFNNSNTVFIALLGMFIAGLIFAKSKLIKSKWDFILFNFGPLVIVVAAIIVNIKALLTPISLGLILYNLGFLVSKRWAINLSIVVLSSLLFAYFLYPIQNVTVNLFNNINYAQVNEFSFLNKDLDTLSVEDLASNKKIILETWNETCGVCINAFNYLGDDFKKYTDELEVFYVYNSKYDSTKYDVVFDNKYIHHKTNVLVSLDKSLYADKKSHGAPEFIFIDENGVINKILIGFKQQYAKEYRRIIRKFVNQD
jgi:hypothetical protein